MLSVNAVVRFLVGAQTAAHKWYVQIDPEEGMFLRHSHGHSRKKHILLHGDITCCPAPKALGLADRSKAGRCYAL